MDFDDSPEEAAFRAEARAWLEAHAQPKTGDVDWSRNFHSNDEAVREEFIRRCKEWQALLYDEGWAGITWPREYGGRGGTRIHQVIFNQEQARFDVATGMFEVGIGMAGPTLLRHGTPEQKDRYLRPMLRGDEVWCQLFSEPGAGSDLASLATKAVRDGDEFVVNGQKVWTSGAHFCQWGILLARTNRDAPKHRGITYFLVDMSSPGVEIRPLRQATGWAHFNEVFLTDVRVPAANVVGEVDAGWDVARTTLGNERSSIAGGTQARIFEDLVRLARSYGRDADPVVRQRLAEVYIRGRIVTFLGYRMLTALSHGREPGPEASVTKLLYSRQWADAAALGLAIEGAAGTLAGEDAPVEGFWQVYHLNQYSVRIGGGTDEVQHNVIGERVLGLPRDPAPAPSRSAPESAAMRQ
jgi:alkylation response protein AidB-like acyl-CoA dehydrogenase